MNSPFFAIIIAVYEREEELKKLLESIGNQVFRNFEVIVVDDGFPRPLQEVVEEFQPRLSIKYYYKENSGPGQSRNFGMQKSEANYYIFLDSDTILPPQYLQEISKALEKNKYDFFGGADAAAEDFNALQKAISFAMTSMISTGGIRGRKQSVMRFQPRSFNMGISRECFSATGGFSNLRVGEDPDLSMRLWEKGFRSGFIEKAWVYHQRRNNLKSFGRQVRSFGRARPVLNRRHPQYRKLSFWFPSFFILGFCIAILLAFFGIWWLLIFYGFYFSVVFISAFIETKGLKSAILGCVAVFIQMEMYGIGFLEAQIKLNLLRQKPEKAFPQHFTHD